jgi:hypothetical protein
VAFRTWLETTPDGVIFHQHYHANSELLEVIEEQGVDVVTTLRDPYDQFVSLFFYVQNFPDAFRAADDPAQAMIGKRIDDEAALSFLAGEFGRYLEQGVGWLRNGSAVVRYEDLVAAPELTVRRLLDRIAPRNPCTIRDSLEAASADRMREQSPELRLHIRAATTGDWRNHLNADHLRAMAMHGAKITELGYTVHRTVERSATLPAGQCRDGRKARR